MIGWLFALLCVLGCLVAWLFSLPSATLGAIAVDSAGAGLLLLGLLLSSALLALRLLLLLLLLLSNVCVRALFD